MPAVSKAQFDKMHVLHAQGKITDQQLANYTVDVNYSKLPERVGPKTSERPAKSDAPPRRRLVEIARSAKRR